MYFLFKCWRERLFFIERKNVKYHEPKLPISFLPIDRENYIWVEKLRGEIYLSQFLYQLNLGDFGYYAMYDGKPVAYGWVKHSGSDDYFFNISESARYLCRFFTHESVRGKGVYPGLITALIEHEADCERFYIDVELGNKSSERGLKKVGFIFVKEFGFIRGFKKTFNKYKLR